MNNNLILTMMNYLFFDTETCGTPKNYKSKMTDVDNWPRVIQLAWVVANDVAEIQESHVHLIKPDGWEVPTVEYWLRKGLSPEMAAKEGKFWKDNGYTQENNEADGLPMTQVLDMFTASLSVSDTMVAHNMNFDYNVLGAELIRYGVHTGRKLNRLCTMQSSIDFCRLPSKFHGQYKFPRLEELHMKLFNESFENAHDALADVQACMRCFFELRSLGLI